MVVREIGCEREKLARATGRTIAKGVQLKEREERDVEEKCEEVKMGNVETEGGGE